MMAVMDVPSSRAMRAMSVVVKGDAPLSLRCRVTTGMPVCSARRRWLMFFFSISARMALATRSDSVRYVFMWNSLVFIRNMSSRFEWLIFQGLLP